MEKELNLHAYDFAILSGISSKTGKAYKVAKLDKRLAFNEGFISLLEAGGASVFTVEAKKIGKEKAKIGFGND